MGSSPARVAVVASDGLEFRYRRSLAPVITNFGYSFSAGSFTAITGPSGCGKSTLLYLLGLMLHPSAGRLMWRDVDVSSRSDSERSAIRARSIGFVFQDALLDPSRTILANVMEAALYAGLEPAAARDRALELLGRFGVHRRATHRPGEISGGQAQRVALCRALVKHPELILADEPSGNLDEASADIVWDALASAAREGVAVVVATHDRRRAALSADIIQL